MATSEPGLNHLRLVAMAYD